MSDKTCGTCSHGLRNIVYCETNNPNANTARLHGAGEAACKRYSERIDSVEQVLNEAIDGCDEILGIFDNMNSSGLLQYGDYSQLFDQICCINERIETARDRVITKLVYKIIKETGTEA